MILMKQAEFARAQGWQRSYVTQLKASGRLVMVDGLVDVERTLELLARTADPNREDVGKRHAINRSVKGAAASGGGAESGEAARGPQVPDAGPADANERIAASYSKSRAIKEHYNALRAKSEYERDILGKLCDTDDVVRAGEGIGAVLRTQLEGLADRLAPMLAPVSNVEQSHALLVEHFERVLNDVADELEKLARAITRSDA